ncbi:SH3 domain-containing protein [Phototrophicus methaneseepsis]|uniref:SH3 domain-containing protein n=1 Tax=Phototrophicus methaneseepsis TaxID=2710758 RepID=A0A7S8E6J7_9CHLR|nr:SH3 domain-containing protein [Phototrophicus methaneseepsis]QPC81306.1 SH3 domain-containing protein [Phototrophicus methaneseepsis]
MNLPPFVAAGIGCAILLFILTGVRFIMRQPTWSFLQFLLAAAAIGLAFLGLTMTEIDNSMTQDMQTIILAVAGALIVLGVIFALVQRVRSTPAAPTMWAYSSGIALSVTGVIFGLTIILAQVTASLTPETSQTYQEMTLASPDKQSQPVSFVGRTSSTTNENAETGLSTRQFVLTPLPTQYVYDPDATPTVVESTGTPNAGSEIVTRTSCSGIVQNNLNLRTEPGMNQTLILTIPYNTYVPVYAASEDAAWLQVDYDGNIGWVSADYIVLNTNGCDELTTS